MNSSDIKKIAILGANGHIAKSLAAGFIRESKRDVTLFSRNTEQVKEFIGSIGKRQNNVIVKFTEEFGKSEHDVVINCVGFGQPAKLKDAGMEVFSLTEKYDNRILNYLDARSGTLYINFSSGAVYGTAFCAPVNETTPSSFNINKLGSNDFYGIAKLNAETKHRAYTGANIVDLRIFSYFSRYIDLGARFFMTDLINCLKSGETFVTGNHDMTRDYVHPEDLFALVNECIEKRTLNDAFDVYSLKPVTKFEILDCFRREFGLEYIIRDIEFQSVTGEKSVYHSTGRKAEKVGYRPRFTSLDVLLEESRAILEK